MLPGHDLAWGAAGFILFSSLLSFFRNTSERVFQYRFVRRKKKLVRPEYYYILLEPSRCPHCGKRINPFFLVPVLGYFLSLGKCSRCQTSISITHPFFEFWVGILGFVFFLRGDFSGTIFFLASLFFLSFIFIYDFSRRLIPFTCIFALFLIEGARLVYIYIMTGNGGDIQADMLWASIWTIFLFGLKFWKKNSLGSADIYLAFILNIFIGFPFSVVLVTLAAFLGILYFIFRNIIAEEKDHWTMKTRLPFAPFLILSYYVTVTIELFFRQ